LKCAGLKLEAVGLASRETPGDSLRDGKRWERDIKKKKNTIIWPLILVVSWRH